MAIDGLMSLTFLTVHFFQILFADAERICSRSPLVDSRPCCWCDVARLSSRGSDRSRQLQFSTSTALQSGSSASVGRGNVRVDLVQPREINEGKRGHKEAKSSGVEQRRREDNVKTEVVPNEGPIKAFLPIPKGTPGATWSTQVPVSNIYSTGRVRLHEACLGWLQDTTVDRARHDHSDVRLGPLCHVGVVLLFEAVSTWSHDFLVFPVTLSRKLSLLSP